MSRDIQILTEASQALFGGWAPRALAAELEVSERSVKRWKAGMSALPEGVMGDLAHICEDHADALIRLAKRLAKVTP